MYERKAPSVPYTRIRIAHFYLHLLSALFLTHVWAEGSNTRKAPLLRWVRNPLLQYRGNIAAVLVAVLRGLSLFARAVSRCAAAIDLQHGAGRELVSEVANASRDRVRNLRVQENRRTFRSFRKSASITLLCGSVAITQSNSRRTVATAPIAADINHRGGAGSPGSP